MNLRLYSKTIVVIVVRCTYLSRYNVCDIAARMPTGAAPRWGYRPASRRPRG